MEEVNYIVYFNIPYTEEFVVSHFPLEQFKVDAMRVGREFRNESNFMIPDFVRPIHYSFED